MKNDKEFRIYLDQIDDEPWDDIKCPEGLEILNQRILKEGWACTVRYHSAVAILRERTKGTIECDIKDGKRERTGTFDRVEAVSFALKSLRKVMISMIETGKSGPDPDAAPEQLTWRQARSLILRKELLPSFKENRNLRANYKLLLALADSMWGNMPCVATSDSDITKMYRVRTETGFGWPDRYEGRRKLALCGNANVHSNLLDLKTLIGKLTREKDPKGNKYLKVNPLAELDLTGGRNVESSQRPPAGLERYGHVVTQADSAVQVQREKKHSQTGRKHFENVVPGFLRAQMVLAHGHGQRPGSVRNIEMDCIALTISEVASAIRGLRLRKSDEAIPHEWATEWPHGAIVYRREFSKKGYERIVPLSAEMRAELVLFLARRAAFLGGRGIESRWLFPDHVNPGRPMGEKIPRETLKEAERLAREALTEAGADPDMIVPHLEETVWYGYRRLWKTIRNDLGWTGTKAAAYVGGWSTNLGEIADVVYARLTPHTMLAVADGRSVADVLLDDPRTDMAKRAASVRPPTAPETPAAVLTLV